MKTRIALTATLICGLLLSCSQQQKETATISGLNPVDFVTLANDKPVALFVLHNDNGAEACITNYGGRLVALMVPDRNGKPVDVVLGYDNINEYLASPGNFGALIGRYGNRIANARFSIDGTEYPLPANNNGHCLHGGPRGYHACIWNAKLLNPSTLELDYLSPDGDEGFPGNLSLKVTYTLTNDNAVDICYEATTDKPTVVNLTNHSYFNLSGQDGSQILDHIISIDADTYTEVDATLIPTGQLASVEGTPMDLRTPIAVGAHIDDDFDQLLKGRGYDHNWVLNAAGDISRPVARVVSDKTGIVMEVFTSEPGIQLYAGNAMNPRGEKGKKGVIYPSRGALCLETQHHPDSPNQPAFPSTTLRPGETYHSRCIYKFSTQK
ncbi:MAG: galactose mutarotase [Tannerellaceae bacterium]|jgi:aldose 1-epimerase|nr:galactose mutarotase [Tannerellaceae bacterium]